MPLEGMVELELESLVLLLGLVVELLVGLLDWFESVGVAVLLLESTPLALYVEVSARVDRLLDSNVGLVVAGDFPGPKIGLCLKDAFETLDLPTQADLKMMVLAGCGTVAPSPGGAVLGFCELSGCGGNHHSLVVEVSGSDSRVGGVGGTRAH